MKDLRELKDSGDIRAEIDRDRASTPLVPCVWSNALVECRFTVNPSEAEIGGCTSHDEQDVAHHQRRLHHVRLGLEFGVDCRGLRVECPGLSDEG